ncbi:hypothetical protein DVH05_027755 [Phytophthora capsici]|nr:hypothetical protein DVH05_027755 [Phytophthora capsici]
MEDRPPTRQRTSSDTTESAPSTPRSTSETRSVTVRNTQDIAPLIRSRLDRVIRTNEPSRRVTASTRPRATADTLVESTPSIAASPTTSVVAEEAVRPITEKPLPPATLNTLGESEQTREICPRVSGSVEKSTRNRQPERVVENTLPERISESQDRRATNRSTLAVRENEPRLEDRQLQMMEAKNDVDVAIKKVELECVQREANVQLLLARKQLMDSGISAAEIDLLLPLPTHARSSR